MMINLIKKIKGFFNKESISIEDYFKKEIPNPERKNMKESCLSCNRFYCSKEKPLFCKWVRDLKNFNPELESILIIDDNPGMISFIEEDLNEILQENGIDKSKYNILTFRSKDAPYILLSTLSYYKDLNITKAIIDITFSGNVRTENGNVRLNGVDIFEELYKINKNLSFFFYTGNQLNPYIRGNKELILNFNKISGKNIFDFVLFKNFLENEERKEFITNRLFLKELSYDRNF